MTLRSVLRPLIVLSLCAVAISGPASAQSGGDSDLRQRRERRAEVRRQAAAKAAEIDVLQASNAEIQRALTDLTANVEAELAALATARQREEVAAATASSARAAADAKAAELAGLEADGADVARAAYMGAGGPAPIGLLGGGTIADTAFRKGYLASQSRSIADVVDEIGAARQDLVAERVDAERSEADATRRREETQAQLTALEASRADQQRKATEIEARLDRALAEAAALTGTDATLAGEITASQAQIAAQLAALQESGVVLGSSAAAVAAPEGDIQVVTVGEITVNVEIADQVRALLTAAAADGIVLGGGGYRSSQRQIELRASNCGGHSHYAIYQKPSSSCRPPTARPGQSNHERGLAIDFTCNGTGSVRSRSSPCFRWLAANAAAYGLMNLPSEPWHWSTTGQ